MPKTSKTTSVVADKKEVSSVVSSTDSKSNAVGGTKKRRIYAELKGKTAIRDSSFSLCLPKTVNKTLSLNHKDVKKDWFLIDAANLTVGKLAVVIADILRGRRKASYTPHVDCGDNVIVVNASKVVFSGSKEISKKYYRHSSYPSGLKVTNPKSVRMGKTPTFILLHAVKGMLSRGPLANRRLKNLHIYADDKHPHAGQQSTALDVSLLHKKHRIK